MAHCPRVSWRRAAISKAGVPCLYCGTGPGTGRLSSLYRAAPARPGRTPFQLQQLVDVARAVFRTEYTDLMAVFEKNCTRPMVWRWTVLPSTWAGPIRSVSGKSTRVVPGRLLPHPGGGGADGCAPGPVDFAIIFLSRPPWTRTARQAGYEPFEFAVPWSANPVQLLSLGGERYSTRFRERLVDMVSRFDPPSEVGWLLFRGTQESARTAPRPRQQAVSPRLKPRRRAGSVEFEGTFDANASPWWLFHLNSVIGGFGDDSPAGRVPCPVYRESHTTARDYYNLQAADRLSSPIAAQRSWALSIRVMTAS